MGNGRSLRMLLPSSSVDGMSLVFSSIWDTIALLTDLSIPATSTLLISLDVSRSCAFFVPNAFPSATLDSSYCYYTPNISIES